MFINNYLKNIKTTLIIYKNVIKQSVLLLKTKTHISNPYRLLSFFEKSLKLYKMSNWAKFFSQKGGLSF